MSHPPHNPDDPTRAFEPPSLRKPPPPADPTAQVNYPSYPSYPSYPAVPPAYPPPNPQAGYPPSGYPPPSYPPPGGYPPPPPPNQYQPGYPGLSYGSGYGGPPSRGTNGMAIASMVTAIASLVFTVLCFIGVLGSIAAVVLGIVAQNQIKTSGQQGRGFAIAGIAVGGFTLLLEVLLIVIGVGVRAF